MANTITLIRVLIALVAVAILKLSPLCNFLGTILILVCLSLDAVDGYVARYLNTATISGGIYDILADRIIENIFFIYFACQSLFGVWIAFIFLIRGLTIDAIRNIFSYSGKTAFGENTIHSNNWTKFLACSRFSRGSYNGLKIAVFTLFAALLQPHSYLSKVVSPDLLHFFGNIALGLCLLIAILRALPVIYECFTANNLP